MVNNILDLLREFAKIHDECTVTKNCKVCDVYKKCKLLCGGYAPITMIEDIREIVDEI